MSEGFRTIKSGGFRTLGSASRPPVDVERERVQRVTQQETALRERYSGPLAPLRAIPHYVSQSNPLGMNSCALAATGNALRFLGLYQERLHNELALLEELARREGVDITMYARRYHSGVSTFEAIDLIQTLAPEATCRFSRSVPEFLRAAEDGAAVLIRHIPNHYGTIPPGPCVNRDAHGNLQIRVADPLYREIFMPLTALLQGDIITTSDPIGSPVLIIERKPTPAFRTISRRG